MRNWDSYFCDPHYYSFSGITPHQYDQIRTPYYAVPVVHASHINFCYNAVISLNFMKSEILEATFKVYPCWPKYFGLTVDFNDYDYHCWGLYAFCDADVKPLQDFWVSRSFMV